MSDNQPQKILVTGASGFIGMHAIEKMIPMNFEVIGIDNLNDYYDVNLKKDRLKRLIKYKNFQFYETDIIDKEALFSIFEDHKPDYVLHLAAQAGVRYSLINPHAYIDSNIQGFLNILEGCRISKIKHLVYASSSSVYGGNTNYPFEESQNIDHPISLYAATKKSNELMAHTYSHLFNIPTTGLRFFTVYGPWGRPDMALFLFADAIQRNAPIDVYNYGEMVRDFTYVDDIVESVVRVLQKPATSNSNFNADSPDPSSSSAPYLIFNIGNGQPTPLMDYIKALEDAFGVQVEKNFLPIQPGDVPMTSSDCSRLEKWIDFKPNTPVKSGVSNFANWYKDYYKV
jgi:UDP-glucuronate 4-epimerase